MPLCYQITLLIILQILLSTLQMANAKPGSDHYYHVGLINGIRANGHRFVRSHPNIIGEKYFSYPQLYHWVLSFLPPKTLNRSYRYFGIVISSLQVVLSLVLAYTVYPVISINTELDQFMVLSGLISVFTPFSYAIWNAKNTGISARGFGLLMGQAYLYFIFCYLFFDNVIFLMSAFLMAFIILLSSQFAMQFITFSAPLFALVFRDPFFLLIPVFAFAVFFAVMPEISRNFFKGQICHKRIYSRYLAEKYILRYRHSIWRDFLWDFWTKPFESFKRRFYYFFYNPFLTILWGFPVLSLLAVYGLFSEEGLFSPLLDNKGSLILFLTILVSLWVFFLTSFRLTRFLGEAERYIEFCIPQLSVLGVVCLGESAVMLCTLSGTSFVFVFLQFTLRNLQLRYGFSGEINNALNGIRSFLRADGEAATQRIRLFSNSTEVTKWFLNDDFKVLNLNLTSLHTGRFHFKELFSQEFPYVSEELVMPIIKEFDINWLILDTTHIADYPGFLEKTDGLLSEEMATSRFKVIRVCL